MEREAEYLKYQNNGSTNLQPQKSHSALQPQSSRLNPISYPPPKAYSEHPPNSPQQHIYQNMSNIVTNLDVLNRDISQVQRLQRMDELRRKRGG